MLRRAARSRIRCSLGRRRRRRCKRRRRRESGSARPSGEISASKKQKLQTLKAIGVIYSPLLVRIHVSFAPPAPKITRMYGMEKAVARHDRRLLVESPASPT